MIKISFRLPSAELEALERISKERGIPLSDAFREAVRIMIAIEEVRV